MGNHVNAFRGIINQLSLVGIMFVDVVRALFLLGSLLNMWKP
jgi:hypothetical protein